MLTLPPRDYDHFYSLLRKFVVSASGIGHRFCSSARFWRQASEP